MINIPKPTKTYWFLMIIATTIGEIVGNYISRDLGLGYKMGSIILGTLFLASIFYTLFSKNKNAILYWLLIIIGNIGGTNIADLICIDLNLGTINGSLLVLGTLLLLIFLMKLVKKENFNMQLFLYWMAIIVSSTFGTTSGDFLTNDTPLGAFGGSIFLFVLLLISVLLVSLKRISSTFFYWTALIIIHPIGATIGNYISKPIGLNLGNIWTSVFLIVLFILLFVYDKKMFYPKKVSQKL
ncbi:hypothetical protein FIA58_004740 [Flavobacterium jejuense]|uniref:Membrane-anchored protein n=1 Tax=Flavobacterium jejuense TaxID=1544455 RepID=A0ABX0IQA2_9FLAO|nr:hypothetical protein [Flavobacterium jejuense]NHN24979.1 hypothetical protein [Flavobacterium jejuense]